MYIHAYSMMLSKIYVMFSNAEVINKSIDKQCYVLLHGLWPGNDIMYHACVRWVVSGSMCAYIATACALFGIGPVWSVSRVYNRFFLCLNSQTYLTVCPSCINPEWLKCAETCVVWYSTCAYTYFVFTHWHKSVCSIEARACLINFTPITSTLLKQYQVTCNA